MADRVLVAVDGSTAAEAAVEFAATESPAATLVLLHVIDPVEAGWTGTGVGRSSEAWYARAKEGARTLLLEAAATATADTERTERLVEVGRPARTIVDVAGRGSVDVDHVVVGSHGRRGVSRVVLGSVAEAVVRNSPVPVTVVR